MLKTGLSRSFRDAKTTLVLNFEVNLLRVTIVNLRFFFELNLMSYFWGDLHISGVKFKLPKPQTYLVICIQTSNSTEFQRIIYCT